MKHHSKIFCFVASALGSGLLMVSVQLGAVPLSLSQVPLVLGGSVDPNIMFLLDDSGSMQWEIMPDSMTIAHFVYPARNGTYGGPSDTNIVTSFDQDSLLNALSRSSFNNVLYYDRGVRYLPWVRSDGSLFPDAPIGCAPHNPYDPVQGCRDFTTANTEFADWIEPTGVINSTVKTYWPAVYWFYNGGNPQVLGNYSYVQIRPATTQYVGGPGRTDCVALAPPFCSYAEEVQNFANWYTYYRSRILAARAGAGRAFGAQGSRLRVGFSSINQGSTTIDGVTSPGALVLGVRPFSGTDRDAFFDRLYGQPIPVAQTPLRRALDDIGQYFERSDNLGPWGAIPGTNDTSAHLSCRQCYNVIMTDGYWNGANAPTPGAQLNVDDQTGPSITHPTNAALNFQYSPVPPFRDDYANTLADVAMYYWNRDLRTDLSNTVPTSVADPAYWQHLVNFTAGLGVAGSLNPATDLPALTAGSLAWPDPLAAQANKIDDLWHTAVNSRGEFFTASNSAQFSNSLSNILNKISARMNASAFLSLSSGAAAANDLFYLAEFNSIDWSGRLRAFPINMNGSLGSAVWDSAVAITAQNFNTGREIVTFDPVSRAGIPFRFTNLNTSQQSALNTDPVSLSPDAFGSQRLDYLRGDFSGEQRNGGSFRNRATNLGDIANSNPVFVGRANNIFPDVWDDLTIVGDSPPESSVPFSGFRSAIATRQQIVYFGANDGGLHGVDAGSFDAVSQSFDNGSGQEELAYIPAVLIEQLNHLTDVNYTHRYYVDASPTVGDAFYGGDWHTVLGGGLGGGGQAIFALDITDPANFDESNAASLVLWEFSDANDPDLGNTYGQPVNIVRLHSGQWAAIFGNGYNNTAPDANVSATGNAVLFIVEIATGNVIRKIDTAQGMAQDPSGQSRPNGLSVPAPVDVDGDLIVDYVYAGDLFGNLWKFDLNNVNPASWSVGFGGAPFFIARDSNGAVQPITVRPVVGEAPQSAQVATPPIKSSIVYFGSGKYFEVGDSAAVGQPTQAFYAVLDKQLPSGDMDFSAPAFNPSHLLEQTIDNEILASDPGNPFGLDLRVTSDNDLVWHTCAGLPSTSSGCTTDSNGNPVPDYLGWRIELQLQGAPSNNGERVVSDPVLRPDRVIFTTLIPNSDACAFGGTGWLMELDAFSGGRLTVQAFDLNRDGGFDLADRIAVPGGAGQSVSVNVSGKRSTVGTVSTPVIVGTGDSSSELLLQTGSSGAIESTLGSTAGLGRLDWMELP
ncbi:MAG: hypothetical protein L0Y43_05150 [Methylococcaceae bacterium]|nr:hypothetical protein [Methylococcaceae bacterium]